MPIYEVAIVEARELVYYVEAPDADGAVLQAEAFWDGGPGCGEELVQRDINFIREPVRIR